MRRLPAPLLRDLSVVDTPGTNVILERQQRLTEEFVPRADLVVFTMSAGARPMHGPPQMTWGSVHRLACRCCTPRTGCSAWCRPAIHGQRGPLPAVHPAVGQEGGLPGQQGGHPQRRLRGVRRDLPVMESHHHGVCGWSRRWAHAGRLHLVIRCQRRPANSAGPAFHAGLSPCPACVPGGGGGALRGGQRAPGAGRRCRKGAAGVCARRS